MRKLLAPLALAVLALGLTGCGSACQDLAGRICSCQPAGALRDNCNSSVKTQIGSLQPSGADQAFCAQKLKDCPDFESRPDECPQLLTAAGKVACGLAYPP
jgi:hypothetical protein